MKKITLLLALLISSIGFSQQQQYHLDFESSPSGDAATWNNSFGGTSPVQIVTNPDPDGTNTSATTKVLKTTLAAPTTAEFWAGVDNANSNSAFGTWKIDMNVASNLTLTMDIHKNYVGTIGIKMATTSNGTTFEIGNQNVDNTVVNEWQTLTFDLSGINPNGDLTNIDKMVVFVDYTKTNGRAGGPSEYVLYVDNIKWNAEKLTDAPAASCTDGIMNGDETGVDCGGSCANACPVAPTTAAPTPPAFPANGVVSVYTKITNAPTSHFADVSGTNLNPDWGNGSGNLVEAAYGGDLALKYATLNYQGIAAIGGGNVDVSGMTHLHFDYFTDGGTSLRMSVISASTGEHPYDIDAQGALPQKQWVGVNIPLSYLTDANANFSFTDIKELKWDEGGDKDYYFDNIYFYKEGTASTENNKALGFAMFPNPANNELRISAKETISTADVFNVLGRKVKSFAVNSTNKTLDISDLSSGIYLVKYESAGKVGTAKFIKQ